MSVRKFVEKELPSISSKQEILAAGYFAVELRPYDLLDHYQEAQQWCSKNFSNKHWCFYYGCWWFTRQNDALLFRITWT